MKATTAKAAAALLLLLTACAQRDPVAPVADVTDEGSADTTADTSGSADTTADTSDGSGDGSGEGSGPTIVQCLTASDCAPRHDCVDQRCILICATDADCDDRNLCTAERCEAGSCVTTFVTPEVGDATPGDCRAKVCVEGILQELPSLTDVPADDGVGCTESVCSQTFPFHRPRNEICDDGDPLNGVESCDIRRGCLPGDVPGWICTAETEPGWEAIEVCNDGQDNNEDGATDEGCPCAYGEVQRCFTGAPATRGVGGCTDGLQRCIDRSAPHWGPCQGAITASTELCDGKDNDCNSCTDDIEGCTPALRCPTLDTASPLTDYTLDGTAFYANLANVIGWNWTVEPPANSATESPADPAASLTSVYLDVSGDYRMHLEVTDGEGVQSCTWTVRAQGPGLRVEMAWDSLGSVDMDLHLHKPGTTGAFCTAADDCYFDNCRVTNLTGVTWGYAPSDAAACGAGVGDTCYNPRLDINNVRGNNPENINIDNPANGDTFRIMAHMFAGTQPTAPQVSIFCGGQLKSLLGGGSDAVRLTQAGAACQGSSWRVADVQMLVDEATGAVDCLVVPVLNAAGNPDVRVNNTAF